MIISGLIGLFIGYFVGRWSIKRKINYIGRRKPTVQDIFLGK